MSIKHFCSFQVSWTWCRGCWQIIVMFGYKNERKKTYLAVHYYISCLLTFSKHLADLLIYRFLILLSFRYYETTTKPGDILFSVSVHLPSDICMGYRSFTQFDIKMRRKFMTCHQVCYTSNTTVAICELNPVLWLGIVLVPFCFVLFDLLVSEWSNMSTRGLLCPSGVTCLPADCCVRVE